MWLWWFWQILVSKKARRKGIKEDDEERVKLKKWLICFVVCKGNGNFWVKKKNDDEVEKKIGFFRVLGWEWVWDGMCKEERAHNYYQRIWKDIWFWKSAFVLDFVSSKPPNYLNPLPKHYLFPFYSFIYIHTLSESSDPRFRSRFMT